VSFCWFSGDWAHVSNVGAICIATGQQGFFIKVFTSPDDPFWAKLVINRGRREGGWSDAQEQKPALKFAANRETKKPFSLSTSPCACRALSWSGGFQEAYPLEIIATSAVVDRITSSIRENRQMEQILVRCNSHLLLSKNRRNFIEV